MDANYSLSDLASVTNGAMGGGNSWWLIIFFLIIFGGGMGFNRQGEFGQYATSASQNEILLGQKFDALGQKINSIGDGICSSTYALNNTIVNEGRTTQAEIGNVRYDMANLINAVNNNIDTKFAQLEKAQLEQTINAQAQQINQLSLAQQMSGVVKYPMASTYAMLNNPFCSCGGCCAN